MNIINYNKEIEDKMVNDIFYLITIYMKNNREVDIFFLKSVLSIVNERKQLEEYIKEISIDNNYKENGAYYDLEMKIKINLMRIFEEIDYNSDKYSIGENKLRKYIRVVECALHEIEHANQEKIKKSDNTLESIILKNSSKRRDMLLNEIRAAHYHINFKNYLKLYYIMLKCNKYYNCCPAERLAYKKSQEKSIEIAKKFNSEKIYDYEIFRMNMNYLDGYSVSSNPTMLYIKKLNSKYVDLKKIEIEWSNLNFEDRKVLGLYLCKEEIDNMVEVAKDSFEKIKKLLN